MSAAPRHRTSWIGQNYDKLILVVVLVALLGSALFLLVQIDSKRKELTEARWEQPSTPPKEATSVDVAAYDAELDALAHPFDDSARSNRMMISELRVSCVECQKPIEFNVTECPFCKVKQPKDDEMDWDGDGIPDAVERAVGLDPLDPLDAMQDMDGDGFLNIDEYQAKSDMSDPESHPSLAAKLRLVKVGTRPFKLRFQGAAEFADGSVRFQLNLRTFEQTFFVQIGDEVEGFEVIEYLSEAPEGPTVVLKQGDLTMPLVKGKAYTRQQLIALIVSLIDGQRMKVMSGDSITLKDRTYNVIDIRRNGVLIRDEKTNKETLVGRLSENERDALRGGGIPSSGAGLNKPNMPRTM